MVRICQYNCQSLGSNSSYIEYFLNNNNIDICCLSEIFSHEGSRHKLLNYNILKKTRVNDNYGGVAICYRKSIRMKKINHNLSSEVVLAKTTNLKENFVICSTYFKPDISEGDFCNQISDLIDFLELYNNVIICGDFNAKCIIWGDPSGNAKGYRLEQKIAMSSFRCINNGSITFKQNSDHCGSVLDLTFTNASFDFLWKTVAVSLGGSHHLPIVIQCEVACMTLNNFVSKNKLLSSLSNVKLEPNIDSINAVFHGEIESATFNTSIGFKPKSWWHGDLGAVYRRLNAATKSSFTHPSPMRYEALLEAKRTWRKQVRLAKRNCYKCKIDELNKAPTTTLAWKFIKNVKNCSQAFDNQWDSDNNLCYLQFLKSQVVENSLQLQFNFNIDATSCIKFSVSEMNDILAKKNKKSAGGYDKVSYEMIKALHPDAKSTLLEALNECFLNCNVPECWRIIKIVPIPKRGRNLSDFKNFRPISLLTVFLKCLNLMIKARLCDCIERNNILPVRSFAYRKNRSAAMCINDLIFSISWLKQERYKVIMFVLDLNDAYNCVDISMLNADLRANGIDINIVNWITNVFSRRILKIGKEQIEIQNGIPQGSCLSPVLFNLYTRSLHEIEDHTTKIYQFADDFIILSWHEDFDSAVSNLQEKIKLFHDACSTRNLTFNVSKTKCMYVAQGGRRQVKLKINEMCAEQVNSIKILGRTISNSLAVRDHCD